MKSLSRLPPAEFLSEVCAPALVLPFGVGEFRRSASREWDQRTASAPGLRAEARPSHHYSGFGASFAARSRLARSNRSLLNFPITAALPANAFFAIPFSSSIASSTRPFAS